MKNKKKAFTLTELLVVVIVIGVLSAVVLPKFSKVIETRKTTEAEELMASVRTEQEKRCALD
ncbi:MAG: prepilin-type N-terminal cleavage/methylation domain-containing protein, partial [Elusimicrobia bacterium]|nr:prepilin-type N-terminal cleavage/methylation domain-containing protein [Elusimicrobiota bacterium]MDD7578462.1 prepilin-type N-terminal cleavage/methylation domain-containing protein [Elusimicrobiota bacterium]